MKKTGSLDAFGSPWRLWIGMNSSKYLFACWTLRLYQDVRAPFTVCNMQPSLFCDVFSWQVSTVYGHLISIKKKKQKKTPYCYLGGIWALHSGYGSCTGGLLLCHRSRCRWPCMRSPEADSCTVGARPCWAGSWVKPMPCSPGRGQKQNGSFFCCVFLLGHLPTHLTCVTPKPTAGMVWGVSKYIY